MSRRGLVGQGYMPKGGVKAAQSHNERVRKSAPVQAPGPVVMAEVGTDAADVRASARLSWRLPLALSLVGALTGSASLVVVVFR